MKIKLVLLFYNIYSTKIIQFPFLFGNFFHYIKRIYIDSYRIYKQIHLKGEVKVNFDMFLKSLYTMQTEPIDSKRKYWQYSVVKNSETEYALFYRNEMFSICQDIPSAISILNAVYRCFRIEFP